MIHSKLLPALALLICCFSACKKDKTVAPTIYPNYSQLKVGNYWVYERYDIDGNGIATASGIIDSCYIEKDTIINGQSYYKKVCPGFPLSMLTDSYLRDSLHYTINLNGNILFSSQNFTDTFRRYIVMANTDTDTAATVIIKMGDKDVTSVTPAGSFNTSALKAIYHMSENWNVAGSIRSVDIRYSENLGVVIEGFPFYLGSRYHTERRLVRYKVQ